ncbi:MAG: UDP-glucose--hexose-1-phosphate uridylyltransferase [Clostridiales bacterium]|nr:UDP-glucose--hexose-1-phosphate uridylyltransferase [Clostridiales bacterium]
MNWSETVTQRIEELLCFAQAKQLIEQVDLPYYRNLLLDVMDLDAPEGEPTIPEAVPATATKLLSALCDLAVEKGLIEDMGYARDLFSTRIMGLLTPSPKAVREAFLQDVAAGRAEQATDRFYHMCRDCDYIKVDAIAQNVRYFADSPAGELEITINLSKPEKDPKEIAKLKNAPSVGYPKCMLCVENPGYRGRSNFPARQNHRVVPIKLAGQDWFVQYSPYAYYDEHCIVFNSQHIPMKISRGTFERLFDFVRQLPHYVLGSNADLPIVGGSILNHDHFQGGRYSFPMDKAPIKVKLNTPVDGVRASILDWPMSAIQLRGKDESALINEAERILNAWSSYSDPSCDILAQTDGTPHNTITPILRKVGDEYRLSLVLRNNRTSDEHPLGIFHPHAPLHHIKKENIGLIEVMGLFILPGRLKTELAALEDFLTGERALVRPDESDMSAKHFDWVQEIVASHGLCKDHADTAALLRSEVAKVCAQVLADAGVFKQDENGLNGFLRFMASLGYQK